MAIIDFQKAGISVVELDWFDENETVSVIPRDRERFEVQKDVAIAALRAAKDSAQFPAQLTLLLRRLATWIRDNRNAITRAFLTLQDGAFAFVVVKSSPRYNAKFEDSLSDLDFEIANDPSLNLVKMNAIALPPVSEQSLLSFVDKRFVLSYADGK